MFSQFSLPEFHLTVTSSDAGANADFCTCSFASAKSATCQDISIMSPFNRFNAPSHIIPPYPSFLGDVYT